MKKLITKILNKIFKRQCKTCKHWTSWDLWRGHCGRYKFYPLCDELACEDACEFYEAKVKGGAR